MLWVIPMAGKGTRTKNLGEFKPFIEIKGHKMFSWFTSSIKHLVKPSDQFVLITLEGLAKKYNFEKVTREIFKSHGLNNKIHYITTISTPRGISVTVYLAKHFIDINQPVIVICPDQYIDFIWPEIEPNSAYLGVYVQLGNKSGFVRIEGGWIVKFVEQRIFSSLIS